MNLAELSGVDPDDLTPAQRLALYAAMVAHRETWRLQVVTLALENSIGEVPVRPGEANA